MCGWQIYFSLHSSLVRKRLINDVVGLETEAGKPEGRGRLRGTAGGQKEQFTAMKISRHSPLLPLVKLGW
jgi:hypothetical protein